MTVTIMTATAMKTIKFTDLYVPDIVENVLIYHLIEVSWPGPPGCPGPGRCHSHCVLFEWCHLVMGCDSCDYTELLRGVGFLPAWHPFSVCSTTPLQFSFQ